MKKRTLIALIVAVCLIFVGGLLLTMGLSYAGNHPQQSTLAQQEVLISEPFDSVVIDTEDCDVKFMPYNGDVNAKVVVMEREAVTHSVLVEDGTLKIKMDDQRKWTDHIGIYNVFGQSENMEMTVYLPNVQYTSIRVTTDTGDMKIPGVLAAEEVLLRTDTGDVWLEGGPVGMLDCMTSTGDITVRGGEGKVMKLRTATGDLDISALTGEELHLASDTGDTDVENAAVKIFSFNGDTGDVELENVQAEEYLQVFTSTGDIDVENSNAAEVNIETSTGDITVPATWQSQRIETDTGKLKFE